MFLILSSKLFSINGHLMCRVDLIGCANEDIPPFFPFHTNIIALDPNYPDSIAIPFRVQGLINTIAAASFSLLPILNLFANIVRFNTFLENTITASGDATWKDFTWSGQHIQPLTYRLLTLRSPFEPMNPSTATHEILRLVLMLYLTPIRRNFGIYPVVVDIHVTKLWALIRDPLQDSPPGVFSNELRFWVLAMGAMEAEGMLRDAFTMELKDIVSNMDIVSFSHAEEVLKSVMLLEVHDPGLRTLWMEIETEQ